MATRKIARIGDTVTWATESWGGETVMRGVVISVSPRGKDPKCTIEVERYPGEMDQYGRRLSELTVVLRPRKH